MAFCSQCGTKLNEGVRFCGNCGAANDDAPPQQVYGTRTQPTIPPPQYNQENTQAGGYIPPNYRPKEWFTAFMLCLFLGLFGAHRFYMGKGGTGVLMLVTLGGLGIWLIIDLVMLCRGSLQDGYGYPLMPVQASGYTSQKDWFTAMMLCLFLGGLGVHRFYAGKAVTGVLMIIVSVVGLWFSAFFARWIPYGYMPYIIASLMLQLAARVWPIIDVIILAGNRFSDGQGYMFHRVIR